MGKPFVLGSFLLGCLLAACGDSPSRILAELEPYFDHDDHQPLHLASDVVTGEDALGIPVDIHFTAGHIVVSDRATDQVLHLLDPATGEARQRFGRRGEGPAEFTSAPRLLRAPDDDHRFYTYDISQNRLTRFELPELGVEPFGDLVSLSLPLDQLAYEVALVDTSRAVGLGFFREGRMGWFDLAAGEARFTGRLHGEAGIPASVLQHAFQAELAAHPQGARFMTFARHSSRIEVFDGQGELLRVSDGPYPFDVDFTVQGRGNPQYAPGPRARYGYLDAVPTSSGILALFSGRAEGPFRAMGRPAFDAEFIHVFDWTGGLTAVWRLDRDVFRITIDEESGILYGLTEDPEPAILAFEIPEPGPTELPASSDRM